MVNNDKLYDITQSYCSNVSLIIITFQLWIMVYEIQQHSNQSRYLFRIIGEMIMSSVLLSILSKATSYFVHKISYEYLENYETGCADASEFEIVYSKPRSVIEGIINRSLRHIKHIRQFLNQCANKFAISFLE